MVEFDLCGMINALGMGMQINCRSVTNNMTCHLLEIHFDLLLSGSLQPHLGPYWLVLTFCRFLFLLFFLFLFSFFLSLATILFLINSWIIYPILYRKKKTALKRHITNSCLVSSIKHQTKILGKYGKYRNIAVSKRQ